MTNYKDILRLNSLGVNNSQIAAGYGCSRTTVVITLQHTQECGVIWEHAQEWSNKELSERLYPAGEAKAAYKMPTSSIDAYVFVAVLP